MYNIIRYSKSVNTISLYLSVVYINDVWTVGDAWNSQNIHKSKQESNGFLSYMFGKSDRSLQVEKSIMSQQLTESQLARKETDRPLQDVMECHQQKVQHSNTRVQETQSQLQEMQSQIVSDTRLQETQFQLQETHVQLQLLQQNFQDCQQQTQVLVSDICFVHK